MRRRLEGDDRRRRQAERRVLRLQGRDLAVVVASRRRDLAPLRAADLVLGPLERSQRIDRVADELDAVQLVDQPVDLPADGRRGDVESLVVLVAHQDDEPRVGVVAELVLKELSRPLALGRRIREAGGLQVLFEAAAEDARDNDEDANGDQDRFRAPPG